MTKPIRTITTLLLSAVFLGCAPSKKEIVKYAWKYDNGYHIGDWIEFNDTLYRLDNDLNIYRNGSKVAVITAANDHEMTIEADSTKEKGRYVNKGNRSVKSP